MHLQHRSSAGRCTLSLPISPDVICVELAVKQGGIQLVKT